MMQPDSMEAKSQGLSDFYQNSEMPVTFNTLEQIPETEFEMSPLSTSENHIYSDFLNFEDNC